MSTSRQRRMQRVPNQIRVPVAKSTEVVEPETKTYIRVSDMFGSAITATTVWCGMALFGVMDWVDVVQPLLFFFLFLITTTLHERND